MDIFEQNCQNVLTVFSFFANIQADIEQSPPSLCGATARQGEKIMRRFSAKLHALGRRKLPIHWHERGEEEIWDDGIRIDDRRRYHRNRRRSERQAITGFRGEFKNFIMRPFPRMTIKMDRWCNP